MASSIPSIGALVVWRACRNAPSRRRRRRGRRTRWLPVHGMRGHPASAIQEASQDSLPQTHQFADALVVSATSLLPRAPGARDDRRGGRRVQLTPSAVSQQLVGARARGGREAARARRARRAARRSGAGAGATCRRAARSRRAGRSPSSAASGGRDRRPEGIASCQSVAFHVGIPAMRALAEEAPDLRTSWWRPSRRSLCPRWSSATAAWCWPMSGSTSPGTAPDAAGARGPRARRGGGRAAGGAWAWQGRRRGGEAGGARGRGLGRRATPAPARDEVTERTCRDLGGWTLRSATARTTA